MARPVRRKKSVNTASSMAERRDAGMMRAIGFKEINDIMQDIGPGDPDSTPHKYQINMDAQLNVLLGEFMWCFLNVMYFDMVHPSYFTPHKLDQWKSMAREVYQHNKTDEDTHRVFSRIYRQMGMCEKRLVDLIHYEASEEELIYTLYDLVLKISMDTNVDLEGLLPKKLF